MGGVAFGGLLARLGGYNHAVAGGVWLGAYGGMCPFLVCALCAGSFIVHSLCVGFFWVVLCALL